MLNASVGFALIGVALLIATVSPLSVARAQDVDAPTVLITGSNRGLGFEFAKQYAAKNWNVIATARNPDAADALQALAKQYSNVAIEQLDVTDRKMIDALAEKYKDQAIDVLLNNAAILRGPTPDQKFGGIDFDLFDPYFQTNAMGPLQMSQAFFEHVKASDLKIIAALTARAGSFTSSSRGRNFPGIYFYRGSKAALNKFMSQLARDIEEDSVKVALLEPGIVIHNRDPDDEGRSFRGLVDSEDSIAGMIKVIENLTAEQSGKIYRWNGEEIQF
jgi:NAD(P)-dependent dehydrogenase (short-subunit alcohol dehydrogenase family)